MADERVKATTAGGVNIGEANPATHREDSARLGAGSDLYSAGFSHDANGISCAPEPRYCSENRKFWGNLT